MRLASRRSALFLTSALTGLVMLGYGGSARAADPTYQFNIPAESLGQALTDFSRESQQQIVFSEDVTAGKTTKGLHGTYTAAQALDVLLAGSGLRVDTNAAGVMMVRPKNSQAASNDAASPDTKDIETVVVTGTHIAGSSPAGSKLIIIDRSAIQHSGQTDVAGLVGTLPQASMGDQNPGAVFAQGANGGHNGNISSQSSANLRGLGSDSTLTLIDGHRFAFDGFEDAVDLSAIPFGAVDRIEVLTDGSSAIYGSDAVAGVVNVILRKDFDGVQTGLTYKTSSDGGANDLQINQLAGTTWSSGNALIAYEYDDQQALFAHDRSYSTLANPATLIPEQTKNSLFGTINQDLTGDLTAHAEAMYTSRDAFTNETFPPTSFPTNVSVQQFGANGGLDYNISSSWSASVSGTYSSDRDRQVSHNVTTSSVKTNPPVFYTNGLTVAEAVLRGPLFTLPYGDVQTAFGGGYRNETFSNIEPFSGSIPNVSRTDWYAFAEVSAPLFRGNEGGFPKADLDAAVRYDDYSDVGTTTNPKVGVSVSPIEGLTVRGSWGTSFRAPSLTDLYAAPSIALFRGSSFGASGTVLFRTGSNPLLKPETSSNWSAGIDLAPALIPNLTASVTYFSIDFSNRITPPIAATFAALSNPDDAPFVTLGPTPTQQAAAISAAGGTLLNASGSPYNPSNVIAIVDDRYANVSAQAARGVDLSAVYHFDVDANSFAVSGNMTWLNLTQRFIPTAGVQTLSGTTFEPPSYRARIGATWQRDGWDVATYLNYMAGEQNTFSNPVSRISSWTTWDLSVGYAFHSDSFVLKGTTLRLSILNLTDADPPHIGAASSLPAGLGYDSTNANPLGRYVGLNLTRDW